jgi:hypothetical protein
MGQWLTLWTVRASMLLYGATLLLMCIARERFARAAWTAGCALLWVHVALAFHYTHHWSHADAVRETARQTYEMTGWRSGAGVYLNYLAMIVWAADAGYWWRVGDQRYRRRGWLPAIAVHVFLLFMAFNAMVVFARGATRWVGAVACLVILLCAAVNRYRSTCPMPSRPSSSPASGRGPAPP